MVKQAGPARLPSEVQPTTVSALTAQIKMSLEADFGSVWVVGEVSALSRPTSGHLYFSLKDSQAVLPAVMWRATALRHRYAVEIGQEVIARGHITVYAPSGKYQMVVEELHQKGAGAHDLALRRLHDKLKSLGYFAPERKKKLPRFPRRIAVVSSPTGAAVRDMLEILGRRWPTAEIWVRGVRVQGDGAAESIVLALQELNQLRGIDVVLLGRGGGSRDDLAVFNDERVAQAIFVSGIPIVSAVGHEIDVTIADLVADRRALTPSEAAEIATPDQQELLAHLRGRAERLCDLLRTHHRNCHHRYLGLAERRAFQFPLERLRELERRLDETEERMRRGMQVRLQQARQGVAAAAARLESLSPLNVLGRGYSLTRLRATQQLVRSVHEAGPGDEVEIVVQDGRLLARVEGSLVEKRAEP
jgi:exodeoxyribonuclease VII large subunit